MPRYSLNVALNGQHYCRIELPDTDERSAVEKARAITKALGPDFSFSLSRWTDVGSFVDISEGK